MLRINMAPRLQHPFIYLFLLYLPLSLPTPSPQEPSPQESSPSDPCLCTSHTQIASALRASCKAITIANLTTPPSFSLELTNLDPGTMVTFAGRISFGFTNSSTFTPLIISNSSDVTITGAPGSVIDGNGSLYWDGLGSNGGLPKPNHFIELTKLGGGSVVQNLNIVNWPAHCFSITGCDGLTVRNVSLDNRAGDAPNERSDGKPAAHNTDGFDISASSHVTITDSFIWNQDDCVAVTSGQNIVARNLFCGGGQGLSVGSVGGKKNNSVADVVFANSTVLRSQNGARIKTNYNTTGEVRDVRWEGITMVNVTKYGIVLQQDYLNGGPTGEPTNGVRVENVVFRNIWGTTTEDAVDYYVLCGEGSCGNVSFANVKLEGAGKMSSCNYPPEGCPTNG